MTKLRAIWTPCFLASMACASGQTSLLDLDETGDPKGHSLSGLYQPGIGIGVDFAETRTYRRCVTTPMQVQRHAFASRLYDESSIRTRRELDDRLNVSGEMSAKAFFGEANGSFGAFKNVEVTGEGFYWLVDARYVLQDSGIDTGDPEFRLTDDAKVILRGPGGLSAFYEACGRFFYSGSQIGAHYALLYEFRSEETHTINQLRARASGQGFGVRAQADFEKVVDLAERASIIRIHAASSGGGAELATYAMKPEALEGELAKLRDALYTRGEGIELVWFMQDYHGFPEVQEVKAHQQENSTLASRERLDVLSDLYEAYQNNAANIQTLRGLGEKAKGADPLLYFEPDRFEALKHKVVDLQQLNKAIMRRAKRCLHGNEEECIVDLDISQALLSSELEPDLVRPDRDFRTLQGWRVIEDPLKTQGIVYALAAFSPDGAYRRFHTGKHLLSASGEIYTQLATSQQWQASRDFVLGTPDMVRDPDSGLFRLNICVYEHAKHCSLRILDLRDNGPHTTDLVKLQLVLYDDYGFVAGDRIDFPLEN